MGCGPIVIRTLVTRKIKGPNFLCLVVCVQQQEQEQEMAQKKKREICWWAHEAGVTFDILVQVHCNEWIIFFFFEFKRYEWIIGYRLMLVIHKSLQIVWCYVVLVL